MSTTLETRYLDGFVRDHEGSAIQPHVTAAHELLTSGKGPGNDFLGWMDLPVNYDKEEFARIEAAAARIRKDTDIFIAIGIGGSYPVSYTHLDVYKRQRIPSSGKPMQAAWIRLESLY